MSEAHVYVLDTDTLSLFQRGNDAVRSNLLRVDPTRRYVTVITFAEQIQGWLAVVRRARSEGEAATGFLRLSETLRFFQIINLLSYRESAISEFQRLRSMRIRIGTQDLRIAAIALSHNATLVTRNRRDFAQIPGLSIVDWSLSG